MPAPTLRRLASAPLGRTKLSNDIAQLAAKVKNKDGTLLLPAVSFPEGRDSAGEGNPSALRVQVDPLPALRAPGMTPGASWPALDAAIHVFERDQDVDPQDKPGDDGVNGG